MQLREQTVEGRRESVHPFAIGGVCDDVVAVEQMRRLCLQRAGGKRR